MSCNKSKRSALVLLPFVIFFFIISTLNVVAQDGEAIFKTSCLQCHSVGKGVVTGPDLKDVHKKKPQDWLIKWIRNSSAVIKSGDPYAVELFKKFNGTQMPEQALTDDEIKAVLVYIKTEGDKAPPPPPTAGPGTTTATGDTSTSTSPTTLLLIIAVLFTLAYALAKVRKSLISAVRQKEGLAPLPERTTGGQIKHWIRTNKRSVALIIILLVLIGSKFAWDDLMQIGVYEGYQPEQPIAFSHKIHAGDNAINCVYCHSGAEKGKVAGVPTANVCMNCHKFIKQGTITGTEEIAKIYKALDYNPETQVYGNNPKPIVWTRVHALPEHAYFNHSQHVVVGKVQCQTCHGPVEEMTVAKQFAPLTMGWCVECHRTTEVQMAGNPYYDKIHANLVEKFGDSDHAKLTVDKIGGTNCSRCHY
jgi:cytochrome c2